MSNPQVYLFGTSLFFAGYLFARMLAYYARSRAYDTTIKEAFFEGYKEGNNSSVSSVFSKRLEQEFTAGYVAGWEDRANWKNSSKESCEKGDAHE